MHKRNTWVKNDNLPKFNISPNFAMKKASTKSIHQYDGKQSGRNMAKPRNKTFKWSIKERFFAHRRFSYILLGFCLSPSLSYLSSFKNAANQQFSLVSYLNSSVYSSNINVILNFSSITIIHYFLYRTFQILCYLVIIKHNIHIFH